MRRGSVSGRWPTDVQSTAVESAVADVPAVRRAARRAGWAVWAASAIVSLNVAAADTTAGRQKAQACAVCHGELGKATAPDAPNLAGQPEVYIATQLRNYRSGKRQHEVMSLMAKPLSDDDITALAGWYASLAIEVKAPN